MKDAAGRLRELLASNRDRYFRLGPAPLAPKPMRELGPQEPEKLAAALRALGAEPPQVSLQHMALRFPPVSVFLERFRAVLARRRKFDFEHEVEGLGRAEQAVAFLALLELRKANEITLSQAEPFAPIRVEQETASAGERRESWTSARSA
jgi:chromatin segregation and condensation protein Rec8/ScpA/Scc1 (kleisin family)